MLVGSLLEKDGFTSLRKLVLNRGQGTLRMEIVSYHLDRNGLPKRLCPFIDPRAWCTPPSSQVYLYHIFGQSFLWKAHEQLAIEDSYVRRDMTTCTLFYGCHVVTRRWGPCKYMSVHWCAFLIKTQRQKTAWLMGWSCTAWPGCTVLIG
jgi:hypothetical protein